MKAVALRQLLERAGGARREQPEIAGVLGNLLPRSPVDQGVKHLDAEPAQPGLALAMCLGSVNDVVPIIDPVAYEFLDQGWWVLAVTVHEQHGAEAGMIETGE